MRYLLGGMLLLTVIVLFSGLLPNVEDTGSGEGGGDTSMIFGIWCGLYLVASALTIWDAVRGARRGDLAGLRRGAVFVKLAGIPFFVLNFLFLWLITTGLLFFGIGFLLAPIAVVWTYLVMLPTSAYGIACLVVLRRTGTTSRQFLTTNLILHLVFVGDVVSTLVVATRTGAALRTVPRAPRPAQVASDHPPGSLSAQGGRAF
ncbi:hypothetical protein EXU48_20045 [Occultella glacieicola]|uniref:Uncharacterized protein n=1 Tax=Occultella glacieicola TaxID=2518684 RepID=A0ABY2DYA8_9MICO|nr:hypothetical protein [Occultella glacieicola]TDE89464.1 hypothetical protein EXU48_20045 [Occultella glacieicola]